MLVILIMFCLYENDNTESVYYPFIRTAVFSLASTTNRCKHVDNVVLLILDFKHP